MASCPRKPGESKESAQAKPIPPLFYNPIIEQTLTTIYQNEHSGTEGDAVTIPPTKDTPPTAPDSDDQIRKKMIFVQYRGKCTENYARQLHKINAPCTLVLTLRKLRTTLPSLKPQIETNLRSGTVYQITCPRCKSCYVGQTSRHILTRFKEHVNRPQAVRNHFRACGADISMNNVEMLKSSARGEEHLLTLEALFIEERRPSINTKDEFKSRALTIKLF